MRYNIAGRYPVCANWLLINKSDGGMYCVKNVLTDEIYEFDSNAYHFLRNLNGNRNPCRVARKYGVDVKEVMSYFEANLLIRTEGRKLLASKGTILHTLYIPQKSKTNSVIPKMYNLFLCVGWLPVLLYGTYRLLFSSYRLNMDFMVFGTIFAIAVGLVLHELSHAMACLSYGGHFFEAGVIWKKVYLGAYVLIDKSKIASQLKRVQVDAAGAEMNLMLTGVFLVLCTIVEGLSGFFLYAALINGILAIFNLTFIDGLDGCSVIGELIGLPGGVDGAKSIIRECIKKKEIKEMSENKKVAFLTCTIITVYQILLPIVLINNVLSFIGGFL